MDAYWELAEESRELLELMVDDGEVLEDASEGKEEIKEEIKEARESLETLHRLVFLDLRGEILDKGR